MSDVTTRDYFARIPYEPLAKVAQEKKLFCAELLQEELEEEEGGTLARKVGEAVTNTIGVVVTAIDIPLGECCPKQDL